MHRFALCAAVALTATCCTTFADTESVEEKSTHQQTTLIKIKDSERPMNINAFCLNADGHIVAVCGIGPGEVRIVNDEGDIVRSWALDVKPEAVNVADDETIFVGGEGKLFRFSKDGKELQQAEAPHAHALRSDTSELRKQAIERLTQRPGNSLASRITLYENVIAQLEEKVLVL